MNGLLFLGQHLGFLVVYGALAWLIGGAGLRVISRGASGSWAAEPEWRPGERGVWATALGAGLIAQLLFIFGLAGLLTPVWTLGGLATLCVVSWWRRGPGVDLGSFPAWIRARGRWPLAVGVGSIVGITTLALYPADSFDGGMYHLPFAARFVAEGALVFMPEVRYPVFPQAGDMGFVLGLLVLDDVAARSTQVLPLLVTAGLLAAWGRSLSGPWANWIGCWAAALWLGTPLAVRVGTQAYVDVSLALHVTASLWAWQRWSEAGSSSRARFWLAICGLNLGFAAATKYLGLFFMLALGAATAWFGLLTARRRGWSWTPSSLRSVTAVLGLGAAVMLVALPWYGRIAWHTGNPVFPFYTPIFGDNPWRHSHDDLLTAGPEIEAASGRTSVGGWGQVLGLQWRRMSKDLGFLLGVPGASWWQRDLFQRQAPLSPFFIFSVPWLLPAAWGSPVGRRGLGLVVAYSLFWLTSERDLRFLFPILPLLCLLSALAWGRLTRAIRWTLLKAGWTLSWRCWGRCWGLIFLLPGLLFAGHKLHERGPLPVTSDAQRRYLANQVPGYLLLTEIQAREAADHRGVYTLGGEHLRYHSVGPIVGDWFGPNSYRSLLAAGETGAAELDRRLSRLGLCHLMVREPWPPSWPALGSADVQRYFQRHEVDASELRGPAATQPFVALRLRLADHCK